MPGDSVEHEGNSRLCLDQGVCGDACSGSSASPSTTLRQRSSAASPTSTVRCLLVSFLSPNSHAEKFEFTLRTWVWHTMSAGVYTYRSPGALIQKFQLTQNGERSMVVFAWGKVLSMRAWSDDVPLQENHRFGREKESIHFHHGDSNP